MAQYRADDDEDLEQDHDESGSEHDDHNDLPVFPSEMVSFEEDTFCLTVCTLIRDSHVLAEGTKSKGIIASRFMLTFGLYILTVFLQVFLLIQVKRWVSSKAVHDIRITYNKFELHMYGDTRRLTPSTFATPTTPTTPSYLAPVTDTPVAPPIRMTYTAPMTQAAAPEAKATAKVTPPEVVANPTCFTETSHGFYRGVPGACFHIENFESMEASDKSGACRISLSQPYFIFTILLMWAIICFSELRKCHKCFVCLIWKTKTIKSMGLAFKGEHSGEDGEIVINGLTCFMKASTFLFCFVPRVLVTIYLLWVGSRWLLATDTFADLILNAVALEFILVVKEMIFVALVPQRYQTELEKTKMVPQFEVVDASMFQLLEVFFWLGLSCGWVLTYMIYIQDVVPSYNWDVHDTCTEYLKKRYAV